MRKSLLMVAALVASLSLAGCSSGFMGMTSNTTKGKNTVDPTAPVGGDLSRSMDQYDKEKLSHALDNKIGKPTQWVNENTGIHYLVMPTQKLVLNGNPYCRKYKVISSKNGSQRELNGTACVSAEDSSWQVVNQG